MPLTPLKQLGRIACLILIIQAPGPVAAHGSVTLEEDRCAIRIGFFDAHFKVYLPRLQGYREYCEDLPTAHESVFVMEYVHPGLGEVPIDFRIIRDLTGLGRFARWEDIREIEDLEAATVYYQPPAVHAEVYAAVHHFEDPGTYIGIVTATRENGEVYAAVFPFEVGFTGFGYTPLFLLLIIAVNLYFFYTSGRLDRWFGKRRRNLPATPST